MKVDMPTASLTWRDSSMVAISLAPTAPFLAKPTLAHQRGVGKLLGEKFPSFLREIFPRDFANFEKLDDLIAALRSYIVLDDYLFDCIVSPREETEIREQCVSHLTAAEQILCTNGFRTSLVESGRQIIEQAKTSFDFSAPIHSVLRKCWYVLLPIELVSSTDAMREPTRQFVQEYLTLLQLFDDFQDIAEDVAAPANQNVFGSNEHLKRIPSLQLQVALIPSLLAFGLRQIRGWNDIVGKSPTASGFASFAESYILALERDTASIAAPIDLLDCNCVQTGRLFRSQEDVERLREKSLSMEDIAKWRGIVQLIRAEFLHRTFDSLRAS